MEHTVFVESLSHRISILEAARDNMDRELTRLREQQTSLEGRVIAGETMQPVILQLLQELKVSVEKTNGRITAAGLMVLTPLVGAVVYWITQGGLAQP